MVTRRSLLASALSIGSTLASCLGLKGALPGNETPSSDSGSNSGARPGALLAWHFDEGVANRWGGGYNVYSRLPSRARTYLDPSVHRPHARHSLRVTTHRESGGFCGVWLEFYPASGLPPRYLDASSYRFFSFWIKGQSGGETFEITLADDTWQEHEDQNPTCRLDAYWPRGAATEWREVQIPLGDFSGLNLRRLARLTLNFSAPGDSQFHLDDVAFKSERSSAIVIPHVPARPQGISPANLRRAVWVWNTREALGGNDGLDRFFKFCASEGITDVFLSLELDLAASPSGLHFDLREPEAYRKFLSLAHQHGMEVEALAGTPEWATAKNHAYALAAVDSVLDFNRSSPPASRFDGVHFDVEPYALVGFSDPIDQPVLLADFLRMILLCASRAHNPPGLRFNCDAPAFFYPASGPELQRWLVTFEGKEKTVGEHLTDLADAVTLMDYHSEADGASGAIASALPALQYAAANGKSFFVGLETTLEPDSTVYFVCGLPQKEFSQRLEGSPLENQLFFEDWRLATFSDEINIHIGLGAPAGLTGAGREAFDKALIQLAKKLGAASDPGRFPTAPILAQARAALAQSREWEGFKPFDLSDPETDRTVTGFSTVSQMSRESTFHGLGRDLFEQETRSVIEWLEAFSSFRGLAIHSYDGYRALLEGD